MSEPVLVEFKGTVAIVRLNRPAQRNALSMAMLDALAHTVTELQRSPELRALVLDGGPNFCAGGDFECLSWPALKMRRYMQRGHELIRALNQGPLPAVAAVQGSAYGAGLSLALACDFVVAEAQTSFCAAFGRIGLMPDFGLLWSLPQRVGIGRARELMYFAESVSGEVAQQWGLVDFLAGQGGVLAAALGLAERLALCPPGTISTSKAALARAPQPLDLMLAWEADTQAMLAQSQDLAEGISALRGKRKAQFQGQ